MASRLRSNLSPVVSFRTSCGLVERLPNATQQCDNCLVTCLDVITAAVFCCYHPLLLNLPGLVSRVVIFPSKLLPWCYHTQPKVLLCLVSTGHLCVPNNFFLFS